MAESPEDKDVDALITDLQSTLDKLKSAQKKDVDDEDSEEYGESKPADKNLREAERTAYTTVRMHRRRLRQASDTNSGKPDPSDGLK